MTASRTASIDRLVTLSAALSQVWVALVIETDSALEARARAHGDGRLARLTPVSYPIWANGLRLIDDDGVSVGRLTARVRAGTNLGGLERWGWIAVGDHPGPDPGARRDGYGSSRGIRDETVLRPTRAGRWARRVWPEAVAEVEGRWRHRFGAGTVERLRAAAAATTPGSGSPPPDQLPWSLPIVGPGDGFLSHVRPAPVDGESGLPLVAVLARALTALTLDHESRSTTSLPLAADLLVPVGTATVRIRDLPATGGISREAVSMAVNHATRRRLAETLPERRLRLTARGRAAVADHRTAATVDDAGLRDALAAVRAEPARLAQGLVPPDGCWRGERPYLTGTRRVLADPLGCLPRQPMVLHRGGSPDGS